jgi:hypothetical protein
MIGAITFDSLTNVSRFSVKKCNIRVVGIYNGISDFDLASGLGSIIYKNI